MKKSILSTAPLVILFALFMACSDDMGLRLQKRKSEIALNEILKSNLQNTSVTSPQPEPTILHFLFPTVPTFPVGVINNSIPQPEIIVTVPDSTTINNLTSHILYGAFPIPPHSEYIVGISPAPGPLDYETEKYYTVFYAPSNPVPGNLFKEIIYTVYVVFPNDFLIRPIVNPAYASIGSTFTIYGNFGGDKSEYVVELLNLSSGKKITLLPNAKYYNRLAITIPLERYLLNQLGEYKVIVIRKGIRRVAEGMIVISNN